MAYWAMKMGNWKIHMLDIINGYESVSIDVLTDLFRTNLRETAKLEVTFISTNESLDY